MRLSVTSVCVQGGDKLTLSLAASDPNLMDLESELPASTEPSNLQLLSTLTAPLLAPTSAAAAGTATTNGALVTPITSVVDAPAPQLSQQQQQQQQQLPISVTYFSQNGLTGVQKETLFTDSQASTNPFTNPFLGAPTANDELANAATVDDQKFATIGRSNPFTSPNKSKNPFLDRLEPTTTQPSAPADRSAGSPMSTSPSTSPEASLDPVSDNGSSTSTLNKIVSLFFGHQSPHLHASNVSESMMSLFICTYVFMYVCICICIPILFLHSMI